MNAIEKLRDELGVCGCDPDECMGCEVPRKVREGLQAVERDYLPLPVDRNGEVLRIWDEVWFHDEPDDDPHIVRGYGMTNGRDVGVYISHADEGWCPYTVTVPDVLVHCKPDPLRELLEEFADEAVDVDGRDREEWEPLLARYAECIRELTGGTE